MDIKDNNVTYILPLDAFDNYIKKTVFNSDSVEELWNPNRFADNTYYEFQLLASRCDDEAPGDVSDGPEKISEMERYQCNVCRVRVPKTFKAEHNRSSKHSTCLKIIENVLERAKDCFLPDVSGDAPKCGQGVYFCEPCAEAVRDEDRHDHELSKDHHKSLRHDKCLQQFLMLYLEGRCVDEIDLQFGLNESSDCDSEDSNELPCTVVPRADSIDDLRDQIVPGETKNEEPGLSLKEYVDVINMKNDGVNQLTVEDNFVRIVALDKSVVRIPEEHFHGLYSINDYMICGLCQYVLKDFDDSVASHIMSQEHINRVAEPITDSNCIRSVTENFKFCILCNSTVNRNVHFHIASQRHNNALELAAVDDGFRYCHACHLDIKVECYQAHLNSKKHQQTLECSKAPQEDAQTKNPDSKGRAITKNPHFIETKMKRAITAAEPKSHDTAGSKNLDTADGKNLDTIDGENLDTDDTDGNLIDTDDTGYKQSVAPYNKDLNSLIGYGLTGMGFTGFGPPFPIFMSYIPPPPPGPPHHPEGFTQPPPNFPGFRQPVTHFGPMVTGAPGIWHPFGFVHSFANFIGFPPRNFNSPARPFRKAIRNTSK